MEYSITYRVRSVDLFYLTLSNVYTSVAGIVNSIFTLAMAALIFRFWEDTWFAFKLLMIVGVLLFPVIQPLAIYFNSKKTVAKLPGNMIIIFSEQGVTISSDKEKSFISYDEILFAKKRLHLLIIQVESKGSYIIDLKSIRHDGAKLYDFLKAKTA